MRTPTYSTAPQRDASARCASYSASQTGRRIDHAPSDPRHGNRSGAVHVLEILRVPAALLLVAAAGLVTAWILVSHCDTSAAADAWSMVLLVASAVTAGSACLSFGTRKGHPTLGCAGLLVGGGLWLLGGGVVWASIRVGSCL